MAKILWVKFGWSDYYRGGPVDGNFGHLKADGNVAHEALNFQPATDGTYYCYVPPVPPPFGTVPNNSDPTGWTVICLAKHPKQKGIHIVGWYDDATLIGQYGTVPETRAYLSVANTDPNYRWLYCISSENAYLVPPIERNMRFSHSSIRQGKFSFLSGPGVETDERKQEVLKLLMCRLERLKPIAVDDPTEDNAPDPEADSADPLKGFGTPKHRRKVEKAAEKAVEEYYRKKYHRNKGIFSWTDVTKQNLGYDFIFAKGDIEHHIEVKGTSGKVGRFFMTGNENKYRENPTWRFAIVTDALNAPKVRVFDNREFKRKFDLDPYVFIGMPKNLR